MYLLQNVFTAKCIYKKPKIVYRFLLIITWDEPKRLQNLAKHGLDFAEFEVGFEMESAVIIQGHSDRFKLIGIFQGELLVAAITTQLGKEALALISLRRASKKEHDIYGW
jgi:uncharacterized DUF497 family protein